MAICKRIVVVLLCVSESTWLDRRKREVFLCDLTGMSWSCRIAGAACES
jgi:hypothetical protein